MKMTTAQAKRSFSGSRVARLATTGNNRQPHIVPVTFAYKDDVVAIAVDHKPKSTKNLKRIRNIIENQKISILTDAYNDLDWSQLWWVRADGIAQVLQEGADHDELASWLVDKYVQYQDIPLVGAVIQIKIHTWTGWSYSG
ncbi:TIGR03668 family PPOX class F420-dependent oxidoreductase [Umezawaea beigongshangensis]|uniref:TIGR03668 family PPOX class F420-dependent oxidoreductase n=1 Tax=Umezawaea beigongshangensis TaxID=2780383 RepID=UPI001E613106|nr:TIGR03668 family PPOX class F420-dependent oxidoreductase [Umezawaea beigongshangensis]